jgi:hypothetical protein
MTYFASFGSFGSAKVPLLKNSYYSFGTPVILQAMINEKIFLC